MSSELDTLSKTPLFAAHVALGARMVPFAGYAMPVQYADGVLAEHRWTRSRAGLFDVSHMGPARLVLEAPSGDADADHARLAALVEPLVSGDLQGLKPGRLRYTLMLAEDGGVLDDLMVGRPPVGGGLLAEVNAGTKEADFALIEAALAPHARLERLDRGGLLALQGPAAAEVISALWPEAAALPFMALAEVTLDGVRLTLSRSGYTGEDGFEILTPKHAAEPLWSRLSQDPRVRPVGLGARDSLRLEAGLPLYGHDLDPSVSPVEAGLAFALSKRRLAAGDLRGGARHARELGGEASRLRVGLRVLEGAPAREGAEIVHDDRPVGRVTSGGFSPSLSVPIAMGFAPPSLGAPGKRLGVVVRGRVQPAEVVPLPFVPHRYARQPG